MVGQKDIIKKGFTFLKKLMLLLLAGVAFYMVCGVLFSLISTHPPQQNCLPQNEIFITSNGVHLDIILPVENVSHDLLEKLEILPGTKYISFGWGDKNFYIHTPEWSDLTFPVAFQALFLKSEAAMHVTCLPDLFPGWKKIPVCNGQLSELNLYIKNSFKTDRYKNLLKMEFEGYNRYDAFYEGKGSFSLFRTCNVWVNTALKRTKVKTAVWSPFDFGVLYHIKSSS
jgi:uncharacterized protein (TIGR02117 family)